MSCVCSYESLHLCFCRAGALGGTQCAYSICFAKLVTKPLITIVHSITHNIDDALQVQLPFSVSLVAASNIEVSCSVCRQHCSPHWQSRVRLSFSANVHDWSWTPQSGIFLPLTTICRRRTYLSYPMALTPHMRFPTKTRRRPLWGSKTKQS